MEKAEVVGKPVQLRTVQYSTFAELEVRCTNSDSACVSEEDVATLLISILKIYTLFSIVKDEQHFNASHTAYKYSLQENYKCAR